MARHGLILSEDEATACRKPLEAFLGSSGVILVWFSIKNTPKPRVPDKKHKQQQQSKTHITCFEGVCVTHVILAPGACGREGPTCRPWHHFRDPADRSRSGRSGIWITPQKWPLKFCAQAQEFRVLLQIWHPKKCVFRIHETHLFKQR
jgi:hypothetical protein